MLDSKKEIRVAATSAMKPVDTTVAEIAAKLLLNFKDVDLEDLLKQGKDVVEPLVPILAFQFESIAGLPSRDDAALGKAQLLLNCLFSCAPNDPLSNKAILKALRSNEIRFQHTGVVGARSIKDGKSGIADVLRVAKRCPNESVRIDAVQTALELADKTNKEVIIKSLGELQLDRSEKIRKAVDSALEKLKEK